MALEEFKDLNKVEELEKFTHGSLDSFLGLTKLQTQVDPEPLKSGMKDSLELMFPHVQQKITLLSESFPS